MAAACTYLRGKAAVAAALIASDVATVASSSSTATLSLGSPANDVASCNELKHVVNALDLANVSHQTHQARMSLCIS